MRQRVWQIGQGYTTSLQNNTTNMALFRGSRVVRKALAVAVDSGIVAPSALYHKNVRYMGILRIMIRNVLF